jgi:hypothetical protein
MDSPIWIVLIVVVLLALLINAIRMAQKVFCTWGLEGWEED